MAADPHVVLLTGDVGFLAIEPIAAAYPDRCINVGVAEQNMIGIATGLSEAGLRPYTYSIAPFASLRPFEFIRNGPVLNGLPVRMIGMGAGFDYGVAGPTHYAVEDVAALRTLTGLTVIIPADAQQAAQALRTTANWPAPVYYSLTKQDREPLPGLDGRFEPGRAEWVRQGTDLAFVAMGAVAHEAVAAARDLEASGTSAAVFVVSCFNPDPDADLAARLAPFSHVLTVEAQVRSGGLAACVGQVIATHGLRCRLHAHAVGAPLDGTHGPSAWHWQRHGLDRASLAAAAARAIGR